MDFSPSLYLRSQPDDVSHFRLRGCNLTQSPDRHEDSVKVNVCQAMQ